MNGGFRAPIRAVAQQRASANETHRGAPLSCHTLSRRMDSLTTRRVKLSDFLLIGFSLQQKLGEFIEFLRSSLVREVIFSLYVFLISKKFIDLFFKFFR